MTKFFRLKMIKFKIFVLFLTFLLFKNIYAQNPIINEEFLIKTDFEFSKILLLNNNRIWCCAEGEDLLYNLKTKEKKTIKINRGFNSYGIFVDYISNMGLLEAQKSLKAYSFSEDKWRILLNENVLSDCKKGLNFLKIHHSLYWACVSPDKGMILLLLTDKKIKDWCLKLYSVKLGKIDFIKDIILKMNNKNLLEKNNYLESIIWDSDSKSLFIGIRDRFWNNKKYVTTVFKYSINNERVDKIFEDPTGGGELQSISVNGEWLAYEKYPFEDLKTKNESEMPLPDTWLFNLKTGKKFLFIKNATHLIWAKNSNKIYYIKDDVNLYEAEFIENK